MTPIEKAIDLKNRFYYALPNNGSLNQGINSCESRHAEAIKCALIAVDEILEALKIDLDKDLSTIDVAEFVSNKIIYWQEVKQEIQKL